MTRVLAAAIATAGAIALGVAAGVTTAPGGGSPVVLAAAQSDACSRLLDLSLPDTAITGAEVVAAGAFTPPTGGRAPSPAQLRPYAGLSAFCRVSARLTPSDDSDIKVEVWMPSEGWNGKYQAVGNGAFTGSIRHNSMAAALARGYASSSTDTGHVGNTASFASATPRR